MTNGRTRTWALPRYPCSNSEYIVQTLILQVNLTDFQRNNFVESLRKGRDVGGQRHTARQPKQQNYKPQQMSAYL